MPIGTVPKGHRDATGCPSSRRTRGHPGHLDAAKRRQVHGGGHTFKYLPVTRAGASRAFSLTVPLQNLAFASPTSYLLESMIGPPGAATVLPPERGA
jgi:hypothetical protein